MHLLDVNNDSSQDLIFPFVDDLGNGSITVVLNSHGSINSKPITLDQILTINENTPTGTLIGSIAASDSDGDELSFTIKSGNEANAFALSSLSGETYYQ